MSWAEDDYVPIPDASSSILPEQRSDSTCLGSEMLMHLSLDSYLLLQTKALRMFSYGVLGVMLVLYLTELNYTDKEVGAIFTCTLFGDSMISLLLTTHADKYGRRNCLLAGSCVAVVTSIIFITQASHLTLLVITATLGVISPSGNEVGPFSAIEISCLAEITEKSMLTKILAWYNLLGCMFCALGSLSCGFFIEVLQSNALFQQGKLQSYRTVFIMYTFVQLLIAFLFLCLGRRVELPQNDVIVLEAGSQSNLWFGLRKSKKVVLKISVLFALEAFAGSFIMQTLISNWFVMIYHSSPSMLGKLLFFCNLLAGVSALFSATIASYIGLLWTMILTDIPSNVLTILVPVMSSELLAIVVLCCQFSISQMDVPARNAYLQGIVEPNERSAANGVANIVRSFGAVAGPMFSGILLAKSSTVNYPWFIAGGLKLLYDLLLVLNFGNVKSTSDDYE